MNGVSVHAAVRWNVEEWHVRVHGTTSNGKSGMQIGTSPRAEKTRVRSKAAPCKRGKDLKDHRKQAKDRGNHKKRNIPHSATSRNVGRPTSFESNVQSVGRETGQSRRGAALANQAPYQAFPYSNKWTHGTSIGTIAAANQENHRVAESNAAVTDGTLVTVEPL